MDIRFRWHPFGATVGWARPMPWVIAPGGACAGRPPGSVRSVRCLVRSVRCLVGSVKIRAQPVRSFRLSAIRLIQPTAVRALRGAAGPFWTRRTQTDRYREFHPGFVEQLLPQHVGMSRVLHCPEAVLAHVLSVHCLPGQPGRAIQLNLKLPVIHARIYFTAPPGRVLQVSYTRFSGSLEKPCDSFTERERFGKVRPRAVLEHHHLDGKAFHVQVFMLGPGLHHAHDLSEILPFALTLFDLAHEHLWVDVNPAGPALGDKQM